MNLKEIENELEREFNCSWQSATEEIPVDCLLVDVIGQDVDLILEIGFVPDVDNQLETMKLLQFMTVLPCQPKTKRARGEVEQLILYLNRIVPLMGFGYDRDSNSLFFRHILMMKKDKQTHDGAIINETVWLISYILEMFYATINAIVLGGKTMDDLKQRSW